ncbi:hypothetical protein ACFC00_41235 [Streptomyces adustus]|uniref:hypothetical protein n=1 Tax=Streptomyces adustus TaxID=1609272 RepID=UPI0035E1A9B5
MAISNKKKAVAAAAIAVGGIALIGAGAGATFTDTVTAQANVRSGHADLNIVNVSGILGNHTTTSPELNEIFGKTEDAVWTISDNGNYAVLNGEKLLAASTSTITTEVTVKNEGTANAKVKFNTVAGGDLKGVLSVSAVRETSLVNDVLAKGQTATYKVTISVKDLNNDWANKTGQAYLQVTAES